MARSRLINSPFLPFLAGIASWSRGATLQILSSHGRGDSLDGLSISFLGVILARRCRVQVVYGMKSKGCVIERCKYSVVIFLALIIYVHEFLVDVGRLDLFLVLDAH